MPLQMFFEVVPIVEGLRTEATRHGITLTVNRAAMSRQRFLSRETLVADFASERFQIATMFGQLMRSQLLLERKCFRTFGAFDSISFWSVK